MHDALTSTPLAGKFVIYASGKALDKQVTIRGDRIHIRVDYDNGTIIESRPSEKPRSR